MTRQNPVRETSGLATWERGLVMHAFGDAFAHVRGSGKKLTAYPYPSGHGAASAVGKDPDLISNYPARYKDYVRSLYDGLAGVNANPALMERILQNADTLNGDHAEQNAAMAEFVHTSGFDFGTLPKDYQDFRPEGGKHLLINDQRFPTPNAADVSQLLEKIRKACCAVGK